VCTVRECLDWVREYPSAHRVVRGCFRRAPVRRFRYTITYAVRNAEIVVVGILHGSRRAAIERGRMRLDKPDPT
jgi:hypothetical protein